MEIIANTSVYNIGNPAGFDLEIGHMQALLAKLTFMDTIFGRAMIQERLLSTTEAQSALNPAAGLKGRDLYRRRWPQGRKFDQDIDLTIASVYKSMAYFYVTDPIVSSPKKDWTVYEGQIRTAQPFSFVFYADLQKLNCPTGEILKIAILKQLNQMNNLIVGNLYESYDMVLKDFTITDNLREYTKFPNYALRIEAVSTFPIFPENNNGVFDPETLIDSSRESISPPGQPNIN